MAKLNLSAAKQRSLELARAIGNRVNQPKKTKRAGVGGYLYSVQNGELVVWGEGNLEKVWLYDQNDNPLDPDREAVVREGNIVIKKPPEQGFKRQWPTYGYNGRFLFLDHKAPAIDDLRRRINL